MKPILAEDYFERKSVKKKKISNRKSVTRDTGFGVTAALPMPDTQLGETHTVPTNPRPVSRYRAHRRLQAPRSSNHILFPGSVCL